MHIHGPALHRDVSAPHHLQNGLAGDDKVGVFQQQTEQAVFFVGQLHRCAADGDAVAGIVQQDLPETVDVGPCLGLCPAEGRPHPAQKLHDAERFGDVVVCAAVEAAHGVQLAGLGRYHDDGQTPQGRGGAELFQDGEAVLTGEHHVQDDQFRRRGVDGLPERLRGLEAHGFVAVGL